MRFLADENIPRASILQMRRAGHDVAAAAEDNPGGSDRDILLKAAAEARILVTFDRDYGELIYKQGITAPAGLIYLRFEPLTPHEPAERLLALLNRVDVTCLRQFTVLSKNQIRQRPLPAGA